jgi:hypothetical protein
VNNDVPEGFNYIVDKQCWKGSSGGPLYLANGRIIGMISMCGYTLGDESAVGSAHAISAKIILDFLTNTAHQDNKTN